MTPRIGETVEAYRARRNAYNRAYEARDRDKWRLYHQNYGRQRDYGLSPASFDDLLSRQDGRCAMCRKDLPDRSKICVDHDHDTGKIRGLLCYGCNMALGFYEPRKDLLDDYLVRSRLDL